MVDQTTRVPLVGVTRCQNCGALISTSGDTHRCATLTTRVEPACHSADVETGTGSPVAASPALSQTTRPPKKVLNALEKVFSAEIENRLPFQSKASIYRDLLAAGLVQWMERTIGSGWSAVNVTGYELTHAGRYLYCSTCEDVEDEPV